MKLRQRRVANVDVGPILPLTMNVDSNKTLARSRRRRKSTQSENITKSACLVVCLLLVALAIYSILAPFPDQPNHRHAHKFLPNLSKREKKDSKKSISCADGKTVGLLDDNYCDCDDGRDEPNTPACSNILVAKQSFRCKDGSVMIHASRVHDGVYDCPDQSDEI